MPSRGRTKLIKVERAFFGYPSCVDSEWTQQTLHRCTDSSGNVFLLDVCTTCQNDGNGNSEYCALDYKPQDSAALPPKFLSPTPTSTGHGLQDFRYCHDLNFKLILEFSSVTLSSILVGFFTQVMKAGDENSLPMLHE